MPDLSGLFSDGALFARGKYQIAPASSGQKPQSSCLTWTLSLEDVFIPTPSPKFSQLGDSRKVHVAP